MRSFPSCVQNPRPLTATARVPTACVPRMHPAATGVRELEQARTEAALAEFVVHNPAPAAEPRVQVPNRWEEQEGADHARKSE